MTTLRIDKSPIDVNELLDKVFSFMEELDELDLNNARIIGEVDPGSIQVLRGMAITLDRQNQVTISNTTGIRFESKETERVFTEFLRFLDENVNPNARQTQTANTAAAGLFFSHTPQDALGERDALGATAGRRPTIRRSTKFLGGMLKSRLPMGL